MVTKKEKRISKFKGAKIYQVFIDRFAGCLNEEYYSIEDLKKKRIYGNLIDLIKKIDYIKSMDFDTIWLTPFYVNQPYGNHGYHVTNFNHVDPYFAFGNLDNKYNGNENKKQLEKKKNIGNPFEENDVFIETKADEVLKKFVNKCHEKGIRVMMDFVPNHCHKDHPFFKKALNNKKSSYREWFYFNEENSQQSYLKFLNIDDLPKLNLGHRKVQKHLINSTKKFLSYGIDAVRIDHCIGPKRKHLRKIIKKIHKKYPEVPFFGEILPFGCEHAPETVFGIKEKDLQVFKQKNYESIDYLDDIFLKYYNTIDGVLDFSFFYYIDEMVSGYLKEEECREKLNHHFQKYMDKTKFLLIKHVDSHDQDRIMFRCYNNVKILQKAMDLLYEDYYERNDPLVVYYGTEDLMTQDDTIRRGDYGDYRCRLPMKFIFENRINKRIKLN